MTHLGRRERRFGLPNPWVEDLIVWRCWCKYLESTHAQQWAPSAVWFLEIYSPIFRQSNSDENNQIWHTPITGMTEKETKIHLKAPYTYKKQLSKMEHLSEQWIVFYSEWTMTCTNGLGLWQILNNHKLWNKESNFSKCSWTLLVRTRLFWIPRCFELKSYISLGFRTLVACQRAHVGAKACAELLLFQTIVRFICEFEITESKFNHFN